MKRALMCCRFVMRASRQRVLQTEPAFVDFLQMDGELPRSSGTSALSGAGVLRLFNKVGDSIGKITYKMDETDQVRQVAKPAAARRNASTKNSVFFPLSTLRLIFVKYFTSYFREVLYVLLSCTF